ncbi:MAG TPA: lasso peptide biosynthesis B2 protein [Candidatus Elarobacter sp.]|nr:lasso peptide biosynthesis B2 protein [Candidatus Elarobacter sp.]
MTIAMDAGAQRLRPAHSIRHANVDGLQVLLDLTTASYYVLDDSASAMWSIVTAASEPEAALAELASSFAVEPERLRRDFDAFVAQCVERGFLERSPPASVHMTVAARARPAAFLLAAVAWRSIVGTRLALAREGFGAVYDRYARLPLAADGVGLKRAVAAFRRAENFSLSRQAPDDCLARSLALFRFLRLAGVPAAHVIGVRRIPFEAHAWVEVDGRPVLDDSPSRAGMTSLARLASTV